MVLHLKDHMKVDIGNQSQHYAGTAFDVGQTLSDTRRRQLWNSARNSGVWSYVEPISVTPTWVHFDKRFGTPACSYGGYPTLKRGSVSNYVLIAQDDLNTLGFRTGGLDRNIWRQNRRSSKKLSKEQRPTCRWNSRLQYMEITSRRRSRNRKNKHYNRLKKTNGDRPLLFLQKDKLYKSCIYKKSMIQYEKN